MQQRQRAAGGGDSRKAAKGETRASTKKPGKKAAGAGNKPVRRARNLRGLVAEQLRDSILSGEYEPGSPLGETELAERFGVSRGPVREALVTLEREYLVRSYPNRGFFVAALGEHEFDERIWLRTILEPVALRTARQRATAVELETIRQHLEKLETMAERQDPAGYVASDYEFHVAIWRLCGQPLLTELLMQISAPVFVFEGIVADRYRRAGYDLVADARAHGVIVDYLCGKTELDAECCLRPVLDLAMRAERPVVFGRRG
ncbi:MAG: GntR family transcriptional regulator [Bryobacterales bacterium]|nr:GntR family transcriptional regulator [Bryobacterales bacterium]